jgi:hypothetical protein
MTPEQETKIVSLCGRIGMPWERVPNRGDEHPWNGSALNLAHSHGLHAESDIVHDVAHWLVAAPERRGEADFGLDSMAYFREIGDAEYPNPGESIEEEVSASLLGILLERAMGMDWRYTWQFHSWDTGGWAGIRPVILSLRQRGLIRGLTPTCLLDATATAPGR